MWMTKLPFAMVQPCAIWSPPAIIQTTCQANSNVLQQSAHFCYFFNSSMRRMSQSMHKDTEHSSLSIAGT